MAKETSKKNVRHAQNARRMIGVRTMVDKLLLYSRDPDLRDAVLTVFKEAGVQIKFQEEK